jgi:DNA repair ATPase RecN
MNLVSIKASNFLRLEAVEITPDGPLVQISGRNGSGKSSVLKALECALAGKDSIPADPVRHGADEAVIVADLGELVVKRVIRPDRSTALTVTNADGFKASSPQKLLEGLFGKLLDPVAFSRMSAKEQRELVADLIGLRSVLDDLAQADQADRDARRDVNRDLKAAEARLAAMPEVSPVEPVDVSATLAEIRAAREANAEAARLGVRRQGLHEKAKATREVAASKREQAQALLAEADSFDAQAAALDASASVIMVPDLLDLSPLERRLEDAETVNAQARAYADREFLAKTVAEYESESQQYTDALTQREAERRAVIEAADLPIPGLGFGEDGLTYNGRRLDQASTAEQMRVSAAIAMALSPKLRVLIVREGSLLDSSSLALLAEMAAEKGFVVLCETVDESGTVGVYIEDGNVAAVNGQAVTV